MLAGDTMKLDEVAVAALDSTAQAADIVGVGAQLRDALARVKAAGLRPVDAPGGVVAAGMGGSAVGARLAWGVLGARARRPLLVTDGYELPSWVGAEALVLCSSYSGGTEETLACYDDARRRGASVIVATTGGALAECARHDGVPVIPLPTGFQPRAAVGYALVTALEVAALAGAAPSLRAELEAAADLVDALSVEWGPDGPEDGDAKTLARRLDGTVPVITGAGLTAPIAYRWKCQLNENAKLPAFWSVLPEADHNEICGWAVAGEAGNLSAVFLEDPDGRPEIARRIALTAELAAAGARTVQRIRARGSGGLERMLSLLLLGDLVSLYLAVLRGVDPVEIAAIAQLKTALSQPLAARRDASTNSRSAVRT
jgi:glucose/mannose-6-phosphate isomerase